MNSSMLQKVVEKMRAARRSHCQTCGCSRCRRIDQLMEQIDGRSPHPEETGMWLIEGRLVAGERNDLALHTGETIVALNDKLAPWAGYQVIILIGADLDPATRPEERPNEADVPPTQNQHL